MKLWEILINFNYKEWKEHDAYRDYTNYISFIDKDF